MSAATISMQDAFFLIVGVGVIAVLIRPIARWIWSHLWDYFPEDPYDLHTEEGRRGERRAILILAWLLSVVIVAGAVATWISYSRAPA